MFSEVAKVVFAPLSDAAVAIVILLGAFTGAVELMGRYRDAPGRALSTPGALLYIAVNILAAVVGLIFLRTIGADLLKDYSGDKRAIYEILIAGFGSLAFLRSSIFNIRLDGKDVSVGPSILLDVLLATADRSVDRRRGADRAREVAGAMKEVSFDKAITALPPFCLALMQNISSVDQSKMAEEVKKIHDQVAVDPRVKSLLLGLQLMNLFSLNVLRAAVSELGAQIKYDTEPPDGAAPSRVTQLLNEVRRVVGTAAGTGTAVGVGASIAAATGIAGLSAPTPPIVPSGSGGGGPGTPASGTANGQTNMGTIAGDGPAPPLKQPSDNASPPPTP